MKETSPGFGFAYRSFEGGRAGRRWRRAAAALLCAALMSLSAASGAASQPGTVSVEPDGTVRVPPVSVPMSSLLSPAGKAYVLQHLRDMQRPARIRQVNGVPAFMQGYLQRAALLFPVHRQDTHLGGVHVVVYDPATGVARRNKHRVLIELHGGGFAGCWPACAQLEALPLAATLRIRVVAVDYREGPEHVFPAASEDVAAVYKTLLGTYPARNIGIYGCSAGGLLTAQAQAWLETHSLPSPGALGIFCAGAGGFGGDSSYVAQPIGEAHTPTLPGEGQPLPPLGYFRGARPTDPLALPIVSDRILARFPPTLLISADRDFAMSGAIYTDEQLTRNGVQTELHVWEGLFHGFFYNPDVPESRQAIAVMVRFFDRHLGR